MEKKFEKAYTLICKLEAEARIAKESILSGCSPYVSLHFAETLAQEAKREWHIQKSKK